MAFKFRYLARDKEGKPVQGELESNNIDGAKKKLATEGLTVESIHVVFGGTGPAQPPSRSEDAAAPKKAAPLVSDGNLLRILAYWGIGIIFLFIVVGVLLFSQSRSPKAGSQTNLKYELLKTEDVGEGVVAAKDFFIMIDSQLGKTQLRKISQRLFDAEKAKSGKLEEARFRFYTSQADYSLGAPYAVLSWNWNGWGAWDYTFTSQSSGQ